MPGIRPFATLCSILFCIQIITAQPAESFTDLSSYLAHHQIDAQALDQGLYISEEVAGSGALPQAGDYVMVKYRGKLLDGTVFDQSEEDVPFVFQLGYRQVILGWEKGILHFKVGSKGRMFVPPGLAYGKRGVGKVIPPNAALIFEIELLDIMDVAEYDRYMVALEKKEREAFEKHRREQFATDKKLIQQYCIDNKLKTKRTSSGISYVITKKGKGQTANPGDQLKVHYEGRLLNGTLFDSSFGAQPFSFVLGSGKVIPGWEEGLQFFKKGSEGWLLLPSKLAYGPMSIDEDNIQIPANSALVFKIKVLDIDRATVQKK